MENGGVVLEISGTAKGAGGTGLVRSGFINESGCL